VFLLISSDLSCEHLHACTCGYASIEFYLVFKTYFNAIVARGNDQLNNVSGFRLFNGACKQCALYKVACDSRRQKLHHLIKLVCRA